MSAQSIKTKLATQTDWVKLHKKSDEDIDYSDSPATTEEFWRDAEVFMPTHKVHLSVRLDEEIVNFFKRKGQGYQSRINAVLKAYVHTHTRHSKHKHA